MHRGRIVTMTQQTLQEALPHHDKLLANRREYCSCLQTFEEVVEHSASHLPVESKESLRTKLLALRTAIEECQSFESDDKPLQSLSRGEADRPFQQATQEWQEVRQLEAAYEEQEAALLTLRTSAVSEMEEAIQIVEQSDSIREQAEQLPLEDVEPAPARQALQAQLQKCNMLLDELTKLRMYTRVVKGKSGDLAKRRKSLLPPAFAMSGAVA